ncbi:hypothetical protein AJ79_09610 [Helicocarpus griseus UAMH5409]|uniref:Uncharacterized protein n=1 Tax=Helicocarpus griseus UAMH5409 TaxID=1447875 RepID=A0A2B7WI62_9EURO|nr:hypothetical protein AJ79_09610 [Helicocarpus griseus UAMH5409]
MSQRFTVSSRTGLTDGLPQQSIFACVRALHDRISSRFILVGGASAAILGSRRTTKDVDILVSDSSIMQVLQMAQGFEVTDGKLYFKEATMDEAVPIDILTTVDDSLGFQDLNAHTTSLDGIHVLKLDIAMAVKVKCAYLRTNDNHGAEKRRSDLRDAVFLARKLKETGLTISDDCATLFAVGYYHMIFLRFNMLGSEFEELIDVGIEKLLIPWNENTAEQQEYYLCFAPEGSDPLTVELDEDA